MFGTGLLPRNWVAMIAHSHEEPGDTPGVVFTAFGPRRLTMSISAERRAQIINEFKVHEKDSGSPEVQVALLTEKIREVTEHLKDHDHDYASRRGLSGMVSKRTRLTEYLRRTNHARYLKLINRLGLRK